MAGQPGQVMLSDRKLEVQRPRLRKRGRPGREVEVPAYAAMRNGERMDARAGAKIDHMTPR